MTQLTAHHLTIGYPEKTIACDLDLSLNAGELICLLGPNGAGKSTLLRTLSGMQPPLEGCIALDGQDVRKIDGRALARRMSVVLTEPVTTEMLTAYELVSLGRHPYTGWMGRLTERDHNIIRGAICDVGAEPLAGRAVGSLSDGERQKILIARALAQEPAVMLLDEPTAYLDLPHRVEIMRVLRRLAHDTGRAVLLSTHDLDLALRSADRIWLMSADGAISVGAPEDLVLSGAFQRTFEREGITFDIESGSFTVEEAGAGTVHLSGEGISALWTRRALERRGYTVVTNGAQAVARVQVNGQNGDTRWQVHIDDAQHEHDSIEKLMVTLASASNE